MDELPNYCDHGVIWLDCKDSTCCEIRTLAEEQVKERREQLVLGYLAKKTARLKEEKKGELEEQKTAEEIEVGEQISKAWDDEDKGRTVSGNRSGLPYDHLTIRAMHQFGALSDRQAKIGHILLDLPQGGKKQSIWEQIARTLGCSSKTVKREWERINTRLAEKKHVYYPLGSIVAIKTRGQRVLQYWLAHEVRFRNWRFAWRELYKRPRSNSALTSPGAPRDQLAKNSPSRESNEPSVWRSHP